MTAGLQLGAPGVYVTPPRSTDDGLRAIRLDATGFVGVCLRGPVDEPTLVTSWTDFVGNFGGITDPDGVPAPGLLPYAVQAFFAQNGVKAWVSRVAPVAPDPSATARFTLNGTDAVVTAANEGAWGRLLDVTLAFDATRTFHRQSTVDAISTAGTVVSPGELVLADGLELPAWSLLRVRGSGGTPAGSLHWVTEVALRPVPTGGQVLVATLDPPLPADPAATEIAMVTGTLVITDRDATFARSEQLAGLGLHPGHPLFPPAVLADMSLLVRTGTGWTEPIPPADGLLGSLAFTLDADTGRDRFAEIDHRSFFDDDPADADPLDERSDHRGVDQLGRNDDIGLLCVPDLTWWWTGSTAPVDPPDRAPATGSFRTCAPDPTPTVYIGPTASTSHLDARSSDGLAEIVRRQQRLVDVASFRRRFVVLLDVPARLALAEIARWRARFDSSFLAAYHPWLGVPAQRPDLPAVFVPPSAFAAGIIASREVRLGLPWGPANELAGTAVTAADVVTSAIHDQLHLLGVNVFRAERDGFRLSAARTLSTDPAYRQLSVRRLMTMITMTLERQSQWLVFEPNTSALRAKLFHTLTQFLGALFRQGAFAGDTEQQSFFVRCDDMLNPPESQAMGRLIAEVGVAPSAPLEYLVLRISQDADGGLQVTP